MQETSGNREEGRHFCVRNKRAGTLDERWKKVREVDDFEKV